MQRGCGIGHDAAGSELERLLAGGGVDDQLAALAALRGRQEERKGDVGPHPAHQRIVDVRAVGVAGLVAREQRPEDDLGPRRQREHGMLGEARLDERAHALEVRALACLQVGLDELGRPARPWPCRRRRSRLPVRRAPRRRRPRTGRRRWPGSCGHRGLQRGQTPFDAGNVYTVTAQERGLTPEDAAMAKLTRKLWVGIGAATIAGASVAAGAAAQDAHKGHPGGQPPAAGKDAATKTPDAGRRGLPHRRRPARHAHPLLPRHRPDARPSPGRRTADRAGALGRGPAAFPASHRRALRRDGEVHQDARHPPFQPRAASTGPGGEGQAQGRLRAGAEGGRPAPRGRAGGGAGSS